jgi:hypothetical protein
VFWDRSSRTRATHHRVQTGPWRPGSTKSSGPPCQGQRSHRLRGGNRGHRVRPLAAAMWPLKAPCRCEHCSDRAVCFQGFSMAGMAASVKRNSFSVTPVVECMNAAPISGRSDIGYAVPGRIHRADPRSPSDIGAERVDGRKPRAFPPRERRPAWHPAVRRSRRRLRLAPARQGRWARRSDAERQKGGGGNRARAEG